MKIFIDCEWNDYRGDLISMGLVSENGHEFYEVLGCDNPSLWVEQNVIPKLGKSAITFESLQERLGLFLSQFDTVDIIADWPEDVEWFCRCLITGPGSRIDTPPITMQIFRVDTVSSNPHNALADAHALRDWWAAER